MESEGLIRKIVAGPNPKDAMAYQVGMRVAGSEVSAIMFDEEHFVKYRSSRYLIFIQDPNGSVTLWKRIENIPCVIEYDQGF